MSGLLIGPHVNDPTIVATFSKNENSAAAMRIRCVCGRFLGSLGQFNPLNGMAAAWKGCRIIRCEELKLSIEGTVEFLRRIGRDPNGAGHKGCGRILIFNERGQPVKVVAPGDETHTSLAAALEKIRTAKEAEARRIGWVKQQEAAVEAWQKRQTR